MRSLPRTLLALAGLGALTLVCGCRNTDRYDTSSRYQGEVISDTGMTGSSASPYTTPHKRSLITGVEEEPTPVYNNPPATYTTPRY